MAGHWSVLFIAIQQSEYILTHRRFSVQTSMESFFFLFFTRVVGATLRNVGIARSIGPLCSLFRLFRSCCCCCCWRRRCTRSTHTNSRGIKNMTQERKGMKDVVVIVLCQTRRVVESLYSLEAQSSFLCIVALICSTLYSLLLLWICFLLSHWVSILPGISSVPQPIFVLITIGPVTFTLRFVV